MISAPTAWLEMDKLEPRASGLGQVCYHLGQTLTREARIGELGFYVPAGDLGIFGAAWSHRPARRLERWTGVRCDGARVWHALHQDCRYWPREPAVRVLVTVHDLNFLVTARDPGPHLHRLRRRLARAAAVVCISTATADTLRQHCPLSVPVEVIHNGNPLGPEPAEPPGFALPERFWLSIAHVHPKKNAAVLLPLLQRFPGRHLVLAGQNDHAYAVELRRQAERLGVSARLHLVGVVGGGAKRWLLENCEAFFLPSLTEGFGLPVVEAMSLGRPLFLARRASLPEIGGPDAFYWDDFDPDAMTAVLEAGLAQVHRDPALAARLRARAATFSWDLAASRYLALYRRLGAA